MLEKTLALIKDIPAGQYVAPEVPVYDSSEVAALGGLLSRLLYAPSQIRSKIQEYGASIVPSNFYSEVPLITDIEESFRSDRTANFDYIFDDSALLATLRELMPYSAEFDPPVDDDGSGTFFWSNSQFSYSDAMAYYCMLRHRKPNTVLEVGSGYSTLVANAAIEKNGKGSIVCIEPYPRDFLARVSHVREVIKQPAQKLSAEFINGKIADGDCIFIDSTHTVKHDSDCVHIYLKILPNIRSDVFIHAHDIFLPRTFSLKQLRDEQIYWTEQYLLCAYLTDNRRAEVVFSSTYNHLRHSSQLESFMHGRRPSGGGSIWFDQSKRQKKSS